MKKHSGMRPQDILILLKILTLRNDKWLNMDLANSLLISDTEISEALNRCKIANLIDSKKRSVNINSLKDFLIYGLKYVYPIEAGDISRGILTAHSAFQVKDNNSEVIYVWPYESGDKFGKAIKPLYKTIPACLKDDILLYELLTIIDIIRIDSANKIKNAIHRLDNLLDKF